MIGNVFKKGDIVSPKTLLERKLIRKVNGRIPPVKILAEGILSEGVIVKGCLLSKNAEAKLEKVGGTFEK